MPSLVRTRSVVEELGQEDRVLEMVAAGKTPAAIARELNGDAAFMSRMEERGFGKVQIGDIHKFMAAAEVSAKSALIAPGATSDAAVATVQATKERIISILAMGGSFEQLTRRSIYDGSRAYDLYEQELEMVEEYNSTLPSDAKERRAIPRPPFERMEAARKNMLACLDILNRLSGDVELKTIVNMQNINVHQGYSQEKVFEILAEIANVLSIPHSVIIEAFPRALMNIKKQQHVAREPFDGRMRGAAFAKAILPGVYPDVTAPPEGSA